MVAKPLAELIGPDPEGPFVVAREDEPEVALNMNGRVIRYSTRNTAEYAAAGQHAANPRYNWIVMPYVRWAVEHGNIFKGIVEW